MKHVPWTSVASFSYAGSQAEELRSSHAAARCRDRAAAAFQLRLVIAGRLPRLQEQGKGRSQSSLRCCYCCVFSCEAAARWDLLCGSTSRTSCKFATCLERLEFAVVPLFRPGSNSQLQRGAPAHGAGLRSWPRALGPWQEGALDPRKLRRWRPTVGRGGLPRPLGRSEAFTERGEGGSREPFFEEPGLEELRVWCRDICRILCWCRAPEGLREAVLAFLRDALSKLCRLSRQSSSSR